MARIIVITSRGEETLELSPGETLTVGRDPANKVPLPDEAGLSRRHCRIGPREGADEGWEVADLGSTNKTRVNGQPIQQRALGHGDEIEIGSVKIRFEDPDEEKRLEALGARGRVLPGVGDEGAPGRTHRARAQADHARSAGRERRSR